MQPSVPEPRISLLPVHDNAWLGEVVECALKGDQIAFVTLYEHYKKPVWNRLWKLIGNREIVEDLFDETFLRVWEKLPEMESQVHFEPWLFRIAVNLGIDYLRRAKKMKFVPLLEQETEWGEFAIFLGVASCETQICENEVLKQILTNMTPRYRTCLVLQDVWGYSQIEISIFLGISKNCVSGYVSRARSQFKSLYEQFANEPASPRKEA